MCGRCIRKSKAKAQALAEAKAQSISPIATVKATSVRPTAGRPRLVKRR